MEYKNDPLAGAPAALLFRRWSRWLSNRKDGFIDRLLHAQHDLFQKDLDALLDVLCGERAGFDVGQRILIGQFFCARLRHHSSVLSVCLVADEYDIGIFTVGMALQLREPVAHVEKRLLGRQIEHENEAHRVAKEGGRQTSKALLPCRVPQLQMNAIRFGVGRCLRPIDHAFLAKVDADRRDELRIELRIGVLVEECGLSCKREREGKRVNGRATRSIERILPTPESPRARNLIR